jgi:hypothetical protein
VNPALAFPRPIVIIKWNQTIIYNQI